MGGEITHNSWFPFAWPSPKGKGTGAPLPCGTLGPAHIGVVYIQSLGHSVVIHHDHDGVFIPACILEEFHQSSEVVINIFHHC